MPRYQIRVIMLLGWMSCGPCLVAQERPDPLPAIATVYGIEIITAPRFPVETRHGAIDGTAADPVALAAYATLFAQEFRRYPVDLVRRTKLKRVIICGKVSFAGQQRNAVPDFEHDTLYLDAVLGAYDKSYQRKVIHHEFFHIIDLCDDGNLYRDDDWKKLNPPGFRYGTGGRNAQMQQDTTLITERDPGFLNHYSTTGVEEDKAELFANMMVNFDVVKTRAKGDPVIATKIVQMQKLLIQFCPAMNAKFWAANHTNQSTPAR